MGAKFGGTSREVELVQLLASPVHRYEGRPVDGPRPVEGSELRDAIELRAGLGVVGDRHFGHPAHRQASVTLQSVEALEHVAAELGVPVPGLTETRRNVLLRGVDVDALVGMTFALDCGAGPVRFRGHRPANPCAWMNEAIAPGAHRALLRRGGIRAEPLTDGTLALGRAVLTVEPGALSRR